MSEIRPQWRGAGGVIATADVIAAVIDAPGSVPRPGSVVLAERAPGFTLVEVVAAPLNPLDLLIASGTFHSARYEQPYVPGSECVGVVVESDVFVVGSMVYAECRATPTTPGAFADRVIVPDENVLVLPAGVDPVSAAAIGNSGTAAYLSLVEFAGLKRGDTVMVLGATGAVGQLAIQIAHRHGAGRVVGVARNRDALERLLSLGADAVVELHADENADDVAERMQAATGPVDVILDGLYGLPLEASLRVCAPKARVVNIGNLAGPTVQLPAGLLRGRQISLTGFAGVHTPLHEKSAALTWLWSALGRGELSVAVRSFPLEDLHLAWRAQARSPHAKCVIVPQLSHAPSTRDNEMRVR